MKMERQRTYEKVILGLELGGFAAVILALWLDEYVDIPFLFFGALKSPARMQEFWFEAITVLLVATTVIAVTLWVFRRLRFMENFIQVCAWCRKVNVGDDWIAFEQYLKRAHDVQSSHSICPTCRAQAIAPRHRRESASDLSASG